MTTKTTPQDYDEKVLQLYEALCAIKTEAPMFDADWNRLAGEARIKRLKLIQKAFDSQWLEGLHQGRKDYHLGCSHEN